MDRILIILKKENGPRASSAPALGLNTIIFKHAYWYTLQISGECLQDHWSSGFNFCSKHRLWVHVRTAPRLKDVEAVLTSTHNLCFEPQIIKIVYLCIPKFFLIKVGFKGVFNARICFPVVWLCDYVLLL